MMSRLFFRYHLVFAAMTVALHAPPAKSEVVSSLVPTRFHDAVQVALIRRADVRLTSAEVDAAAAKVEASRAAFWPRLNLSAGLDERYNYDSFTGTVVEGSINGVPLSATVTNQVPRYQATSALTLNWNLYAGGETSARHESASASLRSAVAQREDAARQVVIDVATAYCELLKAQKDFAMAATGLEAESLRSEASSQSLAFGKTSLLANHSVMLEQQRARLRHTKSRLALEKQWNAYLDAIGLRDTRQPYPRVALTENEDALQGQLAQWAQSLRTPLNQAAAEALLAAQAQVRAEASALRPKVDLIADYSYVGRDDRSLGRSVSDLSRRGFYVGIRFNWTLFDANLLQSRVKIAAAEEVKAAVRAETQLRERLARQVELALRVAELDEEETMLRSQLELTRLETEVAKAKQELQQISPSQYRVQLLAAEQAKMRLEMLRIDLALAKFAMVVQSSP
jgi:outer membrane protein